MSASRAMLPTAPVDRTAVPLPESRAPLLVIPFAVGLFVAAILFVYTPYRFVATAMSAEAPSGGWLLAASALLAFVSVVMGLRWTVLFVLSYSTYRRQQRRPEPHVDRWPFVSVFVPAFNEGETIDAALHSLVSLDYPRFEVLVVDDGSSDDTYERALRFAGDHGRCVIRVFRKPNGGKWAAHNYAFHRCRGELILCLDADSHLEPDSLTRLVRRMSDPSIAGVSGQIRVRNRVNTLTRLQGLEYVLANGALRMAQARSGTVLVVPGPIGLFRRSALEEVYLRYGRFDGPAEPGQVPGPFEGDTFAEDFDLSLAVLSLGGRIAYEPEAVSNTAAPDWPLALLNQRYRWGRGMLQVIRKYFRRGWHDRSIFHPRVVAWLVGTYGLELLLMPLMYLMIMGGTIGFIASGGEVLSLGVWMAAFVTLNLQAAGLFTVMHGDRLRLLGVAPLYDFYQGFMLNSGWAIAIFDELRNAKMRW